MAYSTYNRMVTEAYRLLNFIDEEDLLTSLSREREDQTIYEKGGKGLKKKTVRSDNLEILAVDTKVDLQTALRDQDYDGIVRNYYTLANLVNW